MKWNCLGLLPCFALAACQSMDAKPIDAKHPRVGLGYVLPFTQYATTITWRLDQCPDPAKPDQRDAKIAVKIEAVAGSADDGDLAFIVDPNELQTWTNVTTFSAKWQDGRNLLSTINASAEDHTAQVFGNIIKTAVKILPLVMGFPLPPGRPAAPGGAPAKPPIIACKKEASDALAAAKKAKALLDIKNDLADAATKTLVTLTAKGATMGSNIDDNTKKETSKAIDDLAEAKLQQSGASDDLTEALKPLSFVVKFTWPNSGDEFSSKPHRLAPETLAKWIEPASLSQAHAAVVYLQLERLGTFGRVPGRLAQLAQPGEPADTPAEKSALKIIPVGLSTEAPSSSVKGLRYRMPAQGRLLACSRTPCGSEDTEGVLASFDGPVTQLGFVNVMPFTTRLFGSNSFSAEFAADGSLKSAGYEQKAAPAEVATGAIADAAGQLAGVLDPTVRLQSQTAYLKALKDQRDSLEALTPPSGDPAAKASLDADTALLNAKLSNLQAEIALQEYKSSHSQ